MIHELIAGALYDFMGRLTSLDDPITLSSRSEPHRLLEIFEAWAAERRLNTTNADVQRWHFRIPDDHTTPESASAPDRETARDDRPTPAGGE